MLAFQMKLTPAQVEMLLVMHAGKYRTMDGNETLYLDYDSSWFIPTGKRLVESGLASHDGNRNPTWMITERGIQIAETIIERARVIVERADNRVSIKPKSKVAAKSKR